MTVAPPAVIILALVPDLVFDEGNDSVEYFHLDVPAALDQDNLT